MNKELITKSNEQLCALIIRLKMQLLQMRFSKASGELEKPHTLKEIRKTIARALTILNQRQIKITFGNHGITIYDLKNKTSKWVTEQIMADINDVNASKVSAKKEAKKQASESVKESSSKKVTKKQAAKKEAK